MTRPPEQVSDGTGVRMRTEDRSQPAIWHAGRGVAVRCRPPARRLGALVGTLLVILACLTSLPLRAEPTAVQDIRIAPYGDGTRIVIELNRRVSFRHLKLDQPPRLAIDLPEVAWQVPPASSAAASGLVQGYRFGRFRPGVSRIVLDLTHAFEIRKVFELPPGDGHGHRIVTDLVEASSQGSEVAGDPDAEAVDGQRLAAVPVIPPAPPKAAPPPTHKRIIVIDPGHGGVDPGAIGADGIYEKAIVLKMGLELRRQLEASGRYEVVMTRDTDRIVRLRDRLQVAHESGGQLFVSLHADSLVKAPDVRGASVYTLSERASNDEAARLASKENRADILAGIDLSNQEDIVTEILIDLAQRDANNKSIEVADLLVDELGSVTRMARQQRSQAGFVVLKSPDMPSVLIELGYLSNVADERALSDAAHLAGLAKGIVEGIDRYFAAEPS
jgi:N-acetylmuramoyl-L-alanine amidase